MARVLSVSHARVTAPNQSAYLAVLRDLAARLRARGESLWLFRHPERPDAFLEFSESKTALGRGSRAPRDGEEAALEARLRDLASYAPGADVLWEEVSLQPN